jgi:hypothetical protein
MLRKVVEQDTLVSFSNSDELLSSTTSLTYVDKVVLTFTPLFTGNYKIQWYCELAQSNTNQSAFVRVFDGINIFGETSNYFSVANVYIGSGGWATKFLIKNNSLTIFLQFRASNKTVSIRRARLLVERIF